MSKIIRTAIQIIPAPQNGKDRYAIIFMDKNAYADYLAGEDNSPVTAFSPCASSKNSKVESILIELENGTPTLVSTTEE